MGDWVHCNTCYRLPGNNKKFSLTNCGHIYCEECVFPGSKFKCKMCGNQCTTIILSAKMKPEVELFFTEPMDLWKKQVKQIQQVLQVMDFQNNHRLRLASYNKARLSKQSGMMTKAQRAVDQVRDLEREVMVLRDENSYLKKLIGSKGSQSNRTPPIHRHSPGSSQSLSQGHNPLSKSSSLFNSQPGSHSLTSGAGPSSLLGASMKGPARISVRTPPGQGRFGIPKTPSPQMQVGTPSCVAASLPGQGDVRNRRTTSPMQHSPQQYSSHTRSAGTNLLPPVCMPITPNRPTTPNYTMDCSPVTVHVSRDSQRVDPPKHQIQINYPNRPSSKT